MNNETFKLTYSASEQDEVAKIREKYVEKTPDKMEQLRKLDRSVTQKATMFSIIIGVVGTLVLGTGMSLLMSDFGEVFGENAFVFGVILGIVGIAVLSLAYPVYVKKLKKEREKIAPEIIKLSDELMK